MSRSELFDNYLKGQMTEEGKRDFENLLKEDVKFKEEFELHKEFIGSIEDIGLKDMISRELDRIRLKAKVKWASAILAVAAVIAMLASLLNQRTSEVEGSPKDGKKVQVMLLDNHSDTLLETQAGLILLIDSGTFEEGPVELKIEEALDPAAIIASGLSTKSGDELLETAGMFNLRAYAKGKELKFSKPIRVKVPSDEIKEGMMLFKGEKNKDGSINWVNPVPLSDDLQTCDITRMDLYPPGFLQELQRQGVDTTDMEQCDSIYYSFSGYRHAERPKSEQSTVTEFKTKTRLYLFANNDTAALIRPKPKVNLCDSSVYPESLDSAIAYCEIDPSRIAGIKNSEFNHTILATSEFRERMKYIFSICQPKYMMNYVNNLNLPLWEIDRLNANQSSGSISEKFKAFSEQKKGGVKVSFKMRQRLKAYFEEKYKVCQAAYSQLRKDHEEELNRILGTQTENIRQLRYKHAQLLNENFSKEFRLNLNKALNRLVGSDTLKRVVSTCLPARNYYDVTVRNPGWCNLDRYVYRSTAMRRTTVIHLGEGQPVVRITYDELKVKVNGAEGMERVYAYVLPQELNSYERMNAKSNDLFQYALNRSITYDLVVYAERNGEVFCGLINNISAGNVSVDLLKTDRQKLISLLSPYGERGRGAIEDVADRKSIDVSEAIIRKTTNELANSRSLRRYVFPCDDFDDETLQQESVPIPKTRK